MNKDLAIAVPEIGAKSPSPTSGGKRRAFPLAVARAVWMKVPAPRFDHSPPPSVDILPAPAMLERCLLLVLLAANEQLFCTAGLFCNTVWAQPSPDETAAKFVERYCLDCHSVDDPQAELNLANFSSASDVAGQIEQWSKISRRVLGHEMPPRESDQPDADERHVFVQWVNETLHNAICSQEILPGGPMVRRLNRDEYANTLRDLLGIQVNVATDLPFDGAGGEGFDNAAETLFISPIHAEKYLDAARLALGHALRDPEGRAELIVAEPSDDRTPTEAARTVLGRFLRRAFRRPVSSEEMSQYMQLFEEAYQLDGSYPAAVSFCLETALVSPKFLLISETPCTGETPELLSQHELASRLSYFLWASMPDDALMEAADEGKLHEIEELRQQVARMLHSEVNSRGLRRGAKVREFATAFTQQWLGTRALGREFKPNEAVVGKFDSELEGGMAYEPIFFFEDILSENDSLLTLIDSDFTYVNRALARHYRIEGEFREQPKRVELPENSVRGGVLGMSAVLAVSSYPHRTSPVLRGKWILETLLGSPPPPPPPDVPSIGESDDSQRPTSLREKLIKHRADAVCASCHDAIDPLGFGLENFDVLGRWRTKSEGKEIDASGELPDGTQFSGPDELRAVLLQKKQQFMRHLTAKMLGYALARGLTNQDQCTVDSICQRLATDDYRAQTLILEIVNSLPFRYKSSM
ncbi:MAG: DUF1592 domain-containing protein [Planctomycetales bacterium]|nr:DUF1592 domain-containing protein [Planctomycetales bacterium]